MNHKAIFITACFVDNTLTDHVMIERVVKILTKLNAKQDVSPEEMRAFLCHDFRVEFAEALPNPHDLH